jgi:hypothetical protein
MSLKSGYQRKLSPSKPWLDVQGWASLPLSASSPMARSETITLAVHCLSSALGKDSLRSPTHGGDSITVNVEYHLDKA